MSDQTIGASPWKGPFEPSVLCMCPAEHEANDAFHCVRGRSATEDEERFLCKLLFVVLPQYANCGKKEPVSTCSNCVYAFTYGLPLYIVVPLCNFKTFLPLCPLPGNSYNVRRTGDDARPKTDDQHAGHRHKCFLLTASSFPYSLKLAQEDRVLPDRNPGVLNEGCPDKSRTHTGNPPFPGSLPRGVFTRRQPYKASYLLPTCETPQILSYLQHQPDGGKPSYPGNAPGDLKGLSVPLLPAELPEGCS